MADENWKNLRCKSRFGLSCKWGIGKNKAGRFKAMTLGDVKRGRDKIPLCFIPFELASAVMNGPDFETMAQAEAYVRSL